MPNDISVDVKIKKSPTGVVVHKTNPNIVIPVEIDARSQGGGDKHYTHVQRVASDVWVVTHNLNKYPSITVVDSAETVVIGDAEYLDLNTVRLTFIGAFAGKAYFN